MSQLTDQMNAAIATLQSQHGVTTDQVNTIVTQANAPLIAQLTAAVNSEKDDASQIADVKAALSAFTTAFAPVAVNPNPGTPVADGSPTGGTTTAATGTAA